MSDLELPQDIMAVLPTDPYEQLDIARKLTSMAVSVRVSELEVGNDKLRQKLEEKESTIYSLQQHVMELEQSLQETTGRLSQALDEQTKLMNEKCTISASMKKLSRDVAKLETFKRTLMQSLQEDEPKDESEKVSQYSNAGSGRAEMELLGSRMSSLQSVAELATISASLPEDEAKSMSMKQMSSSTPSSQLTPQLTPTGSPKRQSTVGSPLQQSASGSHQWHAARLSLPSSNLTSQHSTAPNSPPQAGSIPARTPRVDGKEFFRQARTRLSYQQFSAFLGIIKELNAHRQTKEETLKRAEEIFGSENKDLYTAFDGLLSRHLPAI